MTIGVGQTRVETALCWECADSLKRTIWEFGWPSGQAAQWRPCGACQQYVIRDMARAVVSDASTKREDQR